MKGFSYPTPSKSSSADLNICVPGEKNSPFLKKATNNVTSDIDDSLPLNAEGLVTSSPENELLHIELKKSLSPYKIPKEYIQVSHIPRNELGKIVYEKLRSL